MAGEVVACELVKLACKRHLRDLEEGGGRGLVWRPDAAQFRINFYPRFLRHSKGEWARKPVELAPWQKFIVGSVYGWKRADGTRRFRYVYQEVARKNGKALAINTPVPTPNGWKSHGDLMAGDLVFGRNGSPVRVLSAAQHHVGPSYAVAFSDGTEIVAHAAHEWDTRRTAFTGRKKGERRPLPLVETQRIAETLRHGAGELVHSLEATAVLQTVGGALPIPPYTLGVWLGDGHSAGARFTGIDLEVVDGVRADGFVVTPGAGQTWSIRHGRKYSHDGFAARLRELGVYKNKHLPTAYLRARISDRRELLAGLVDTDGHVTARGQVELVTVSMAIRDGAIELARGLGLKPTLSEDRAKIDGRDCGPRYRIQFWAKASELPLRIGRKRRRLRDAFATTARSRSRQIISCAPVGDHVVNCIEVEGGFYLAGAGMVPTHNSTMLAGVGLDMLVCDGEPGAEVYAAATKKDQARIIFEEAKRMVGSSPALTNALNKFKLNISIDETASKFEPLSSDENTLDGLNPHCVLIDELHKHKTRALLDVMDTAVGARRQPLIWIITTAGDDNPASVYANEHGYAVDILEGTLENDGVFAFVATIDKDDRWDDPVAWAKANPNLGISVKLDDLERQALKAKGSPSALNAFKRLRLNVRTSDTDRVIDAETWAQNSSGRWDPDKLPQKMRCWGGLDLSSKIDITAWVKLFEPDEAGVMKVAARFWMPADTIDQRSDRDRAHYRQWVNEGWIEPTAGNVIDHDEIYRDIIADKDRFDIQSMAFDPWSSQQLGIKLNGEGVQAFEFVQGIRSYTAPTKELQALLAARRLDHGDNPVLRWMANNLAVQRDKNLNEMPHKAHSTGRIDGMTALIMAIGRQMQPDGTVKSPWEDEGFSLGLGASDGPS